MTSRNHWGYRDAASSSPGIAAEFGCVCAVCQQAFSCQTLTFAISACLSPPGSKASIVAVAVSEQSELRRIARGLGKPEMAEGMRGQETPARGALQIAALDQEWLDDVFDRVARLRQRCRHGLHADRAAAVIHRDGGEITPVHGVEAGGIDLQRAQRIVGYPAIDRIGVCGGREIAHAAQQAP